MADHSKDNRYVAYFDILGFKDAVKHDIDVAWGALEDLRVSMQESLSLFTKTTHSKIIIPNSVRTQATNFSDSVLIFTFGDTPQDLHTMLIESAHLFAMALKRCVPLRGGISYGRFYFDFEKNLFCGPSLVRAYEIAEGALWSGIVVDDAVADRYKKDPIKSRGDPVIKEWRLPSNKEVCSVCKQRHIFDWVTIYMDSFTEKPPISAEQYSKVFERLFQGRYRDWPENIRAIYDNTVGFINYILAKGDK